MVCGVRLRKQNWRAQGDGGWDRTVVLGDAEQLGAPHGVVVMVVLTVLVAWVDIRISFAEPKGS